VFVANKRFVDSQPAAERKALADCAQTAAAEGRRYIRDNERQQLAELKAQGMQIDDSPDLPAFRKATQPVIDSLSGDTKKMVEQIRAQVK